MRSIEDPTLKHKTIKYYLRLVFLLLFLSGELIWVVFYFVNQPSEEKRAFLFGFSLIKISIIIFLLFIVVALFVLFFSIVLRGRLGLRFAAVIGEPKIQKRLIRFFSLFGSICWIVFFVPPSHFKNFTNGVILARPLLLLGIAVSCQIIAVLILTPLHARIESFKNFLEENKNHLLIWGILSIIFMMIWGYIAISRVGLFANNEDYWHEAGVPILGLQILAGLIIGLVVWRLENYWSKRHALPVKTDLVIFILIWVVAGLLWAQTPLPNGYFNPGPYPPTYEAYPYADAARYDLMSQYALIGQGLNNGVNYNRPAYPAFLVFLHAISGQNYERNMQFQAAIFGIFPALIYLIAKSLFNRGAGVATATIILLRGINGIAASDLINLANQKQMLTDFPTAIVLCLVLLICLMWIRRPQKLYLPFWVGGLFGLALYLRQTILGVLPVILLLPVIRKRYSKKSQAIIYVIFLLGILVTYTPYEIKGLVRNPYSTYPTTIKKIVSVVRERYPQFSQKTSSPKFNNNQGEPYAQSEVQPRSSNEPNKTNITGLGFIENHFLHNIVTSILTLPNSFTFNSLREDVKAEYSYWKVSWDGRLSFEQSFILFLNLLLIGLGIASSINKQLLTGFLPLMFFVGYNLANALGRTSGGRYIVPVDWIIIVYFSIGLFQVFQWIFNPFVKDSYIDDTRYAATNGNLQLKGDSKNLLISFVVMLILGMLLVVPDWIFPKQLKELNRTQLQQEVMNFKLMGEDTYLQKLLASDKSTILMGKIMYPRFYLAGKGEIPNYFPYKPLDYSRLDFYLIGVSGTQNILLAGSLPKGLTNTSSAIIVGCRERNYIDAAVVVLTEPVQRVYFRDPLSDPTCPLPVP